MSRIRFSQWLVGISLFGLLQPLDSQGQGIIDASGRSIETVGSVGAVANRRAADNLFRNAINDERRAISKFPPNVGLLSKALVQTMSGIKADNQSRANGQAAIESLRVGDNSGIVDITKKYGNLSRGQIQHYANNSSPHLPQVEKTLAKYGMGISADRQSLTSPIGTIPLDMDSSSLSSLISKVVESKGLSSEGVQAGVQAGIESQNAIGRDVTEQAKAELDHLGSRKGSAESDGSKDENQKSPEDGEAQGRANEEIAQEDQQETQPSNDDGDGQDQKPYEQGSGDPRGPAGLTGEPQMFSFEMNGGPIGVKGSSHQDIFEMISIRYQIHRSKGTFLE